MKIAAVRDGAQLWQPKGEAKLFVFASNSATLHEEIDMVDIATGAVTPVLQKEQSYAAVAEAGPINNFSAFATFLRSGNAFRVQEMTSNLGGTPWSARETYIETSPFFFLDRVQTPLMIVQRGVMATTPFPSCTPTKRSWDCAA